ncbi:hypothetical protein WJX84_003099 [Apatococcus fuscideae]|uniref:DNA polymerase eta n=1 Tax=Apatococcus fuscideae TaxID=2026836 RepID=A0AAW1T719_9CHLO
MAAARVILHIDLDCFYCQVEQKRLGIPASVPCAVQQWEGLIAVNYAARAAGITRHMRVKEARQHCPDLKTVHVQTLGGSDGNGEEFGPANRDKATEKACLERYRRASVEIIGLLHRSASKAVIEKASIDEVYIDVTALVDEELQERAAAEGGGPRRPGLRDGTEGLHGFAWGSVVVGGPLDEGSEVDQRLACGAAIACRLRGAVREQLGFTCSAGIAGNKLLAKIASAMNKPNQQTLVPSRAVPSLMSDLPLKKLRNFGGKLGQELEALGCTTAGEVARHPRAVLEARFGMQRTAWMLQAVNGISDEPVQVKEKVKSMLAAKSFDAATSDVAAIKRWFRVLGEELCDRMLNDYAEHHRHPRTLSLSYRGGGNGGYATDRSKAGPMPRFGKDSPSIEAIADAAMALFQKATETLPCTRLALSAHDFAPAALTEQQGAITRFFAGPAASAPGPSVSPLPSTPAPSSSPSASRAQNQPGRAAFDKLFKGVRKSSLRQTSTEQPSGSGNMHGKHIQPADICLDGVDIERQRRILQDIRVQQAFAARGSDHPDEQQASDILTPQPLHQKRDQQELQRQMKSTSTTDRSGTKATHPNMSSKRPRLELSKTQPKLTSLFGRLK